MRVALAALITTLAGAPTTFGVRLDSSPSPILAGAHVGTLQQASHRFGPPDRLTPTSGAEQGCNAVWRRLGLTVTFSAGCDAPGSWQRVTLTARRWQTRVGLHVGDSTTTLHALYPNARRLDLPALGIAWKLQTGGPLCDGGPPLALTARTAAGHVSALLAVHVPACG